MSPRPFLLRTRTAARLGLLLLLAVPPATAEAPPAVAGARPATPAATATGDDLAEELARLDPRGAPVESLLAALEDRGEEAALRALEGLEAASPEGRRARAELVERVASPGCLAGVLARLDDSDPVVRAHWMRYLGRPTLGPDELERRIDLLARALVVDPDATVRAAARESLAESGLEEAAARLDRATDELPPEEAAEAAKALGEIAGGRRRVVRRVRAALAGEGPARPAVLAAWLGGYGQALAEIPAGGQDPGDRAPFLLAASHPDARVRAAARQALEDFATRLVERDELDRTDAFLAQLAEDGLDPDPLRYRRARLAIARRGDPERALELADELLATGGRRGDLEGAMWRFYAHVFRGAAELALDRRDASRADFLAAEALSLSLLGEREDLLPDPLVFPSYPAAPRAGELLVDRLQLAALCRLWLVLVDRADPPRASVEDARIAHAHLLRAQALAYRTDVDLRTLPWDALLDHDLGPPFLFLRGRELAGWREGRALEAELFLGRCLATVSPREMPGFEPFAELAGGEADPLVDPLRRELLSRLALDDLRHWRRYGQDPRLFDQSPEEARRQRIVARVREDEALRNIDDAEAARASYRSPSEYARRLADVLRADGRPEEARVLSERMLKDLSSLEGVGPLYQEWASARIQLSIASSWMDEGRPADAELAGLDAVRRLETLRASLQEEIKKHEARGEAGRDDRIRNQAYLDQTEALLANALLSLAVNANVRGKDPEKALRFFERAYEYDQSEFMQVLLACYRARSGRAAEARAILARVEATPSLYYNLACTYALLGDTDTALDYLRREFAENHPTEAGRRQQAGWARDDPDLASLRGDPRFERILESE